MGNPEKLATLGIQDDDKQNKKHNTICVGHHYTQTNTNNVNKTWALLQTTGKQFLLFIGNTLCYSYIQSSPAKVLAVIEERKYLRKK